ncbi:MAG: IS1595 family transposase [Acidobacteriia bacterium]|nr:IS1595 family transposase [Terriglobia bacterium]
MNLLDIYKELNTEAKCLAFLETMRWPEGVKCLSCNSARVSHITSTGKTGKSRHLYQCNDCRFQFTATTGTVYHDTHLPLSKWFLAIALITESKKGISANQLARALGVQYRTAWYLAHRIRKAMVEANQPKLKGIVEVDETYLGGKHRGHRGKMKSKDVVIGIRQRGGDLRFFQAENAGQDELAKHIKENVSPDLDMIVTDEWQGYPGAMISAGIHGSKHETIKHKEKIYVRGNVHTNTVESAFSLFKRGLTGSFHKISLKHLQRYLNEFSFRFNNRKSPDLFGMTVRRMALVGAMPYSQLIEENAFTPFVRR